MNAIIRDDEQPNEYSLVIKLDTNGLATIAACRTSDPMVRLETPRKYWAEHKALLLETLNMNEVVPEDAERDLLSRKRADMKDVWLTSTDLERLDLRMV